MCTEELTTIDMTIEDLAERWEYLLYERGAYLRVTEQFKKRECVSYVVSGLTMEFEDECVICHDFDNRLLEHLSVLILFLKQSLKKILLLPLGGGLYQEELEFDDGKILIEIEL